jgi:hypothetical protein
LDLSKNNSTIFFIPSIIYSVSFRFSKLTHNVPALCEVAG